MERIRKLSCVFSYIRRLLGIYAPEKVKTLDLALLQLKIGKNAYFCLEVNVLFSLIHNNLINSLIQGKYFDDICYVMMFF